MKEVIVILALSGLSSCAWLNQACPTGQERNFALLGGPCEPMEWHRPSTYRPKE